MTNEEFKIGFDMLVKAFTVAKPFEKSEVYLSRLGKIHGDVWIKTCEHAVDNCEKFPTIMKIIQIADNYSGFRGRQEQQCSECDGFGTLTMWKHTFRARCLHGEKVSKHIPLVPVTTYEKQRAYDVQNKAWKELYGTDLERGEAYISQSKNIFDKAKDTFGMGRQDDSIMAEMAKIFPKTEEGCMRWAKGQKYLKANLSMTSRLYEQWVANGKRGREYFGDDLVEKCWKSL